MRVAWRRTVDQEVDDELRFHPEMRIAELGRRGSPGTGAGAES
jgi:hypothetical protein